MSDRTPSVKALEREYVTRRIRTAGVTADVARAEFHRGVAEVERAAAERAWGEGAMAQWRLGQSRLVSDIPANPYRKTKEEHDD
ncbi:hypothetical protein ACI1US_01007 [Leucobacter sp. BZR 635]